MSRSQPLTYSYIVLIDSQTTNSGKGSNLLDLLVYTGRLFAKNGGALGSPITRHFAWGIIPLSWLSKKVRAVLISHQVVRFPFSPVLVLSLQWSAINPIPLRVISVSLQPNPRFRLSDRFLFHHQFVKEVVFFG